MNSISRILVRYSELLSTQHLILRLYHSMCFPDAYHLQVSLIWLLTFQLLVILSLQSLGLVPCVISQLSLCKKQAHNLSGTIINIYFSHMGAGWGGLINVDWISAWLGSKQQLGSRLALHVSHALWANGELGARSSKGNGRGTRRQAEASETS